MQSMLGAENMMLIARVLALLFAIPLHELSHALVSYRLGDPTAHHAGRITLNPLKHIDVMGLLSMMIIGVGWAKPVPVDSRYYKNRKLGMAATAVAGPLSNLVLALVGLLVAKCLWLAGMTTYGTEFLGAGFLNEPVWRQVFAAAQNVPILIAYWPTAFCIALAVVFFFSYINVSLAIFNLLPIPPLDGSRILAVVLSGKLNATVMRHERKIMLVLLGSMVLLPYLLGFSPIGVLLYWGASKVMGVLDFLTGFVGLLWF